MTSSTSRAQWERGFKWTKKVSTWHSVLEQAPWSSLILSLTCWSRTLSKRCLRLFLRTWEHCMMISNSTCTARGWTEMKLSALRLWRCARKSTKYFTWPISSWLLASQRSRRVSKNHRAGTRNGSRKLSCRTRDRWERSGSVAHRSWTKPSIRHSMNLKKN